MRRRGQRQPPEPIETDDPQSLPAQIDRHIGWLSARGYSESGLRTRRKVLIAFCEWCAERGVERPSELTRGVIEAYQRRLSLQRKPDGKPLTAHTQSLKLSAITKYCSWMTRERLTLYNPASEIELPKSGVRLPKAVLTVEEAERIIAVPDISTPLGLRDRVILETFYATGIRRTELSRLKLADTDLDRGVLAVRQGKNRKDRFVPLGERAGAWISKYLEESRPVLARFADDGSLFLTVDGTSIRPNYLGDVVHQAIVIADVGKEGGCHLFRHTVATLMLEGGADIRFIQQMLGHASVATTQIYTQVSLQKLKAVHEATHPGARLSRPPGGESEDR
jgi:integrase/recombinase XerD